MQRVLLRDWKSLLSLAAPTYSLAQRLHSECVDDRELPDQKRKI